MVVGASSSGSVLTSEAFLYRNGTLIDLGPGVANAINASGTIVGTSRNNRAVLYQGGQVIDLGNFGSGLTSAVDINDFGQIAGYSYVGSAGGPFVQHPFLYQSGTWRLACLPDYPWAFPAPLTIWGKLWATQIRHWARSIVHRFCILAARFII